MMFETVNILKNEFARAGYGTIATGNSHQIAGLYAADRAYVVPSVSELEYIPALLKICRRDDVKAILTFLDRDILRLAEAAAEFRDIGVEPMVVNLAGAKICDNKLYMFEFLSERGFKCAHTVSSLQELQAELDRGRIRFPVFVKPIVGDGSRGATKCCNIDDVNLARRDCPDMLIQEYLDGPEYDIDLYVDTISKRMVSVFTKEKLVKVIGGTATGLSIRDKALSDLVDRLAQELGLTGALNIEAFNVAGEYYIGEVNPRFGATYIGAYACGINFAPLMINNIEGKENLPQPDDYPSGICMMKYPQVLKVTAANMSFGSI